LHDAWFSKSWNLPAGQFAHSAACTRYWPTPHAGVGAGVGTAVGTAVGVAVGTAVGAAVGMAVGVAVGVADGAGVGAGDGAAVGWSVGAGVGAGVSTHWLDPSFGWYRPAGHAEHGVEAVPCTPL
jgi:hypothetical protein